MSKQEKTVEALRKNENNWELWPSWDECQVLAIVYEDGSHEVARVTEGLASFLCDYAELNGYDVIFGHEVVQ